MGLGVQIPHPRGIQKLIPHPHGGGDPIPHGVPMGGGGGAQTLVGMIVRPLTTGKQDRSTSLIYI